MLVGARALIGLYRDLVWEQGTRIQVGAMVTNEGMMKLEQLDVDDFGFR